jgi:tetratricopeptide (TPR) repeat protein
VSASGKQSSAAASHPPQAPQAHQGRQVANNQVARQSEHQNEIRSGAVQPEASQSEAKRLKKPKSPALRSQGDETLQEGEMSALMKASLLFITFIIGMGASVLIYEFTPAKDYINKLIGAADPYEKRQIPYRPGDPEIRAAFALHLEGRSDDARTRINAALATKPTNAEALYYLGRIDLDQKKYNDAETHLKEAAKLDAKLPDVWAYLAMAYLGMGQQRNALDALRNLDAQTSGAPSASPQSSPAPAK